MKTFKPTAAHLAFRTDAIALINKHAGHLSAEHMLALASHLVGQIVAYQDSHTMTGDRAMEIVAENVGVGNHEAMAEVMGKPAGSA